MASLDLTQDRGFHEIEVEKGGERLVLKLPKELTVAQVERILDLQIKAEQVAKEEVIDNNGSQLQLFWKQIFAQLLIMFRVYQPDISEQELREMFTSTEALTIAGFFENNRFLKIGEENSQKKTLLSQNPS